jgi:hypothetical protein
MSPEALYGSLDADLCAEIEAMAADQQRRPQGVLRTLVREALTARATSRLYLTLDPETFADLEAIAAFRHRSPQALAKFWIRRSVKSVKKAAGKDAH